MEPVVERVEAELAAVEAALARLDDGSYGTCEVCGSEVDDTVLAADPTARLCAAHVAEPEPELTEPGPTPPPG